MPRHPHLTGDALTEAMDDAARCKATGRHRLEPIPLPPGAPRPSFGSLLAERCELCGTVRYAHVSRLTGDIIGRYRYDWPDSYLAAAGEGVDKAGWRVRYWDTFDPGVWVDAEPGGHVKGKPARKLKAV